MIGLINKFLNYINVNLLIKNILAVILFTLFFIPFKNYSNISDYIIITIITVLQAKYFFGDLDKGYELTYKDIIYWLSLITSSLVTISVYKMLNEKSIPNKMR